MTELTVRQMRALAAKQGLKLSTRGGMFHIIDPTTNTIVAGRGWDLYADDVVRYLTEEDQ